MTQHAVQPAAGAGGRMCGAARGARLRTWRDPRRVHLRQLPLEEDQIGAVSQEVQCRDYYAVYTGMSNNYNDWNLVTSVTTCIMYKYIFYRLMS